MAKRLMVLAFLCIFCISCGKAPSGEREAVTEEFAAEPLEALMIKDIKPIIATYGEPIIIADFNSGEKPNNIEGDFGAWDRDPKDMTQHAEDNFIATIKRGDEGYSIQIYYDVDSPNPAYNGFWMDLTGLDASNNSALSFWIKGDKMRGYTTTFKVELENEKGEVGKYYVSSVSDDWKEVIIPLKSFGGLNDLSSLSELTLVFEDMTATKKEGAIYIEDISIK
ncbi:MAG: carbohydrate binding domain-containing protein [Candidatus Kaelpia aquatica]|nr:carbohydrate binding domain-containing protein [Candidatus Kaelpia aquatica]